MIWNSYILQDDHHHKSSSPPLPQGYKFFVYIIYYHHHILTICNRIMLNWLFPSSPIAPLSILPVWEPEIFRDSQSAPEHKWTDDSWESNPFLLTSGPTLCHGVSLLIPSSTGLIFLQKRLETSLENTESSWFFLQIKLSGQVHGAMYGWKWKILTKSIGL